MSAPFPVIPVAQPARRSHRLATFTGVAGLALIGGSFALAETADRRYRDYLAAVDPVAIEERYDATVRMDRLASGALLGGEALLAVAVWLRFVRGRSEASDAVSARPERSTVAVCVRPERCAIAVRF